jgi:FixJ family two-component response regulator
MIDCMDAGGTVLVVEADASMREALERLLAEGGYGCVAFASAEALLARVADDSAACVISDLRLPGMSGLELLSTLRERHMAVPVIVITAHDMAGLREEVIAHGAANYLAKPFRGSALLKAVAAATALAAGSARRTEPG